MNKKLWSHIIILVLMIAIICMSSLAAYHSIMNKNNNQLNNSNGNNNNTNTVSQEELLTIINNELFVLNPYTGLDKLTNQDKLDVAVKKLCGNIYYCIDDIKSYIDTFSSTNLANAYIKTSLAKFNYTDEDVKCPAANYEHSIWKYDNVYKKYTYVEPGHGANSIAIAFKKIVSFTKNGNEYKISIKYAWYKSALSDGPANVYAFATYMDAKNNTNSIYMIATNRVEAINYDVESEFNKYFTDNYETYKDKIPTYNYVFEYQNNQLYLTNFNVN